ncbi:MAG: alpha/beta hydrolase [Gemmatimonadetes bacterium]|nr:alpha/beta hydrolase [Gemmatimonadota bacterium]
MTPAEILPLWPAGAPGAVGTGPEDAPSMTMYRPARPNGIAVLVFAGGGYGHIAVEKEGEPAARWLNSLGVTAFVVQYRLGPRYHHPAMLQDAQRAIRTVRANAGRWSVRPDRVGVLGFSAGGHLAATAGTHFDGGRADAADPVERVGSRPDFLMLLYPVVTMREPWTHRGSRTRLLGADPDPGLVTLLSNELQVSARTPPTFLVASSDDPAVPVQNTLLFYQALRAAGVPVEMHVYQRGGHGFGLAPDDPALSTWPRLAGIWLENSAFRSANVASR